jgi:hypothetical protein
MVTLEVQTEHPIPTAENKGYDNSPRTDSLIGLAAIKTRLLASAFDNNIQVFLDFENYCWKFFVLRRNCVRDYEPDTCTTEH